MVKNKQAKLQANQQTTHRATFKANCVKVWLKSITIKVTSGLNVNSAGEESSKQTWGQKLGLRRCTLVHKTHENKAREWACVWVCPCTTYTRLLSEARLICCGCCCWDMDGCCCGCCETDGCCCCQVVMLLGNSVPCGVKAWRAVRSALVSWYSTDM